MKINKELISFLLSAVVLISLCFSTSAYAKMIDVQPLNTGALESMDGIQATLTSAIDGSPFIASYDPETGIVSQFSMDGELIGERQIESEEAFWELVRINTEVTRDRLIKGQIERINRNVSIIDHDNNKRIEFDEYGHKTETPLIEKNTLELFTQNESTASITSGAGIAIQPRFDTIYTTMYVPYARTPAPSEGKSVFVGGGYHKTYYYNTSVRLWTGNFPSGMHTIDVYFSNVIGDDNLTCFDVNPRSDAIFNIRYGGENYGARVSSYYGSFYDVELSFSSWPLNPNGIPIYFSPNGGTVAPGSIIRVPGTVIGSEGPMPIPTKNNSTFIGWFTTDAPTGGIEYTNNSIMPSSTLHLSARWSSPSNNWMYMFDNSDFVRISSDFAKPSRPDHNGIDIVSKNSSNHIYGTPIKNACDGVVRIAQESETAGYFVVIESTTKDLTTNKNLVVRYLHMKSYPLVTAGSNVINKGTILGYVGNSGSVSPMPSESNPLAGTHLHFDINNAGVINKGAPVSDCLDPKTFFPHVTFTY